MQTLQLIALTPPGLIDPSIAIAASRAGELGALNLEHSQLEHSQNEKAARDAIARMTCYASQACGIKLDSSAPAFVDRVTRDLPEQVEVAILTPWDSEALRQQVPSLRQRRVSVLLEVACLEQAQLGEQLGVDGLIAKGREAAGWVGEETTFTLLQRLLSQVHLPIWAQGGIGLHTAAACYAAGAAGVVLDSQLVLTRESQLPGAARAAIAAMDGSETVCLGGELGQPCRVYARPGWSAVEQLREMAITLAQDPRPQSEVLQEWRQAVEARVGWGSPQEHVWLLGQDAAFAAPLQRHRTVGGVLGAIREAVSTHIQAARALRPLDKEAAMARSHGACYPIVQGPMTRVSDRAEFALRVAEGGALPFLALALMRAPEVSSLLEDTQQLLGERPWGVGILGFAPLDLRQEQMEVVRKYRPPFALIAGGRSDQARELEKEGVAAYLHAPSPELLRMFLRDGARRFVFEGHESGGHVGPRSSFVLWNTMIDVLLEELPAGDISDYHVLFAGGIHDALSASMVAALAAPLAERGVRVGVLLGTSYLFTQEAVATGAILPGFQEEALRCQRTVLLETGPGHAVRCAPTPYADLFEQEKQRLLREGKSPDEIRQALEDMNVGRLRIASRGITRHPRYGQDPETPKFITVGEEEQHDQGMYMIGQLAALRDRVCTIEELHRDVSIASSERLATLPESASSAASTSRQERPCDVAIVGMACLLPKACDLQTYWENILNKVDAITEAPKERWDWERYYDPDRRARDKVYSRWGGFLEEIAFDPTRYGIPPSHEIHVQVSDADGPTASATPIIEGAVIFDETYPDPPAVSPVSEAASAFELREERPSRWMPEQLYEEGMFHGPAFRGVASMDRWGEDGAEATLEVLPLAGLFAPGAGQTLLTDPVLLDQPGQVVAFWMAEHLEQGYVIFPFRLEALHLFGPLLPPGERVKCQARIALVGDWQVRSGLDVVRRDGRVWARFVGWEDKRFDLPRALFRFLLSPRDVVLSEPRAISVASSSSSSGGEKFQAYQLGLDAFAEDFFTAHGGIWQRVLVRLVLSRREREIWRSLRTPESRRLEWLLGRVVAKDAVRQHLKQRYGLILCPADIEILPDDDGRPVAQGAWTDQLPGAPILSLSHSSGVAMAVAGDCSAGVGVGVDIEHVGRMNEDVEGLAFTPEEQELLSSVRHTSNGDWPLRFWCAKEAVAKALGQGMIRGPQALLVKELDAGTGSIKVSLALQYGGEMARRCTLTAYTAREGDLIVATALCERT